MKALLVSYDFPPVGGVGVQRASKLAKYLPASGVQAVVLSNAHAYSAVMDEQLYQSDCQDMQIIRKGGESLLSFHQRVKKNFFSNIGFLIRFFPSIWRYGDVYGQWYTSLRSDVDELIESNDIDCVITTTPPHSVMFFGLHCVQSKRSSIPWIADMRDSMVDNADHAQSLLERFQGLRLKKNEQLIAAYADSIVVVSEGVKNNFLKRYPQCPPSKVQVIPNGYDPDDFKDLSAVSEKNTKFTLSYAGTFLGQRSPDVLISALVKLLKNGDIDPNTIKLQMIGAYSDDIVKRFEELEGLIEVDHVGFVEHSDALRRLTSADVLLLLTVAQQHIAASEVIPSKVYEYMALGKPILALTAAEGPLVDLIKAGGLGLANEANDINATAQNILSYYRQWQAGDLTTFQVDEDLLQQFSRKTTAATYSQLINSVVSSRQKNS